MTNTQIFSLLSSQDVLKCFFLFMPVMGTGKMTLGDFLLTKTKTFNYGKGDHRCVLKVASLSELSIRWCNPLGLRRMLKPIRIKSYRHYLIKNSFFQYVRQLIILCFCYKSLVGFFVAFFKRIEDLRLALGFSSVISTFVTNAVYNFINPFL